MTPVGIPSHPIEEAGQSKNFFLRIFLLNCFCPFDFSEHVEFTLMDEGGCEYLRY